MKANESLPNYDSKVRESTNFIIKSIKQTCKDAPSRRTGSEGEKKAQQYVRDTMEKFADSIETQEFRTVIKTEERVRYFSVFYIISIISAFALGFVCHFLPDRNLNYLFFIPVAVMLIGTFPIPKKGESENIVVKKSPSGEMKRRIVFLGNINSPVERFFYLIGSVKLEKIVTAYALTGAAVCYFLNLLYAFKVSELNPIFSVIEAVFLPAGVAMFVFYNTKKNVMGVNGNLTGAFDSMAVIQFLSYNNLALENTEVVAVSCGAGIHGAIEFMKEPFDDVDTVFVSVDNLLSDECFSFSGSMSEQIKQAAVLARVKITEGKDEVGSSLENALSKKKVSYTRISGYDEESGIYSTEGDDLEMLSPMAIEAGLKLSLETAYLFDEKGI
jgi:hypothetical protein